MNPNMLLGDLINYAKMTETISKQIQLYYKTYHIH